MSNVFSDPLWDLPLSRLQFNESVPTASYLDIDPIPSIQDQLPRGNVLEFSSANRDTPTRAPPPVPMDNVQQEHLGLSGNSLASNSLYDVPPDNDVENIDSASPMVSTETTVEMMLRPNDQVDYQPNSPALHDGRHTAMPNPHEAGVGLNLCYSNFLLKTKPCLWDLEIDFAHQLDLQRAQFSAIIPTTFIIPQKATLSRYFYNFEKKFQVHFSILHSTTFRAEYVPLDLVLTVAAIGSISCGDKEEAMSMFAVARDITLERVRQGSKKLFDESANSQLRRRSDHVDGINARTETLRILQALVLQLSLLFLLDFQSDLTQVDELKFDLVKFLRNHYLNKSTGKCGSSWEEWVSWEGTKRAIYISFSILTLVTMLINHPHVLMNGEIDIELPCTENEWRCTTQEEWQAVHASSIPPQAFQAVLRQLLDDTETIEHRHQSPLSDHVLLLALSQHFQVLQQLDMKTSKNTNLYYKPSSHHRTLEKWRILWESCKESSLDPFSPDGSLTFTSAILYHTSFVRNHLDLGKLSLLSDLSPEIAAAKLFSSGHVRRSNQTIHAAMHAICALEISLRIGLAQVVPDKSPILTLEFAICALECCLLLTKWLNTVAIKDVNSNLSQDEHTVLKIVTELLERAAVAFLVDSPGMVRDNECSNLGVWVAKLWAELFKGTKTRLATRLRTVITYYGDLLASQ